MKIRFRLISAALFLTFLSIPIAPLKAAQPVAGDASTIASLAAEVRLIFLGKVLSVRFRLSDGEAPRYTRIPQTYVTFAIEEIYHGSFSPRQITLRFAGGATGVDGRVMRLSNMPMFKEGDRSILFVNRSDAKYCPLVACAGGRYRIVDDYVFDDHGRDIILSADGSLRPGARRLPAEAIAMVIPPAPSNYQQTERRRLEQQAAQLDAQTLARERSRLQAISAPRTLALGSSEPLSTPDSGNPPALALAVFERTIRTAVQNLPQPEPVAGVGFNTPVLIERPQPVEFNIERDPPPAAVPAQTRERALFERNGGNPVIVPR